MSLRLLSGLVALGVVTAASLTMLAAPASAAWTLYCTSYTRCAEAGYSNAGYKTAGSHQYWRMYAGHNCTNYVAYRMVQAGLPNVRPWTGSGNATNWGSAMSGITDGTPTVGAAAWWRAHHNPAGSAGHVAYVERVIDANTIVVSQDSWGGDFSWARITRTGGSWPSGFVHFTDTKLTVTSAPSVTGTAKVGSPLTATAGRFSPAATTTTYTWRADGTAIAGATSSTFTPTAAQVGHRITVRTTGSRSGYPSASTTSSPTAAVVPAVLTSSVRPAVTGTPAVGTVLAAAPGTWSPSPQSLRYQWTANRKTLVGATGATFRVAPEQLGTAIRVRVTAVAAGYPDTTVRSLPTVAVAAGTIRVGRAPSVTGTATLGTTLGVHPGAFTPADATTTTEWSRDEVSLGSAPTLRTTAADLGSRLRLRTTVTRPGYAPLVVQTRSDRVRAVSRVRLSARTVHPHGGAARRVRITARVTAPAVADVSGTVRITRRGRTLRTLTLHAGRATTTVRGIPAGARVLRAAYARTSTVTSGSTRTVAHLR